MVCTHRSTCTTICESGSPYLIIDRGDLLRVVDTLSKENSMQEFYECGGGDVGRAWLAEADKVRLRALPIDSEVRVYFGIEYEMSGYVYQHGAPEVMTAEEAQKAFL
jgi:hypothetical protein